MPTCGYVYKRKLAHACSCITVIVQMQKHPVSISTTTCSSNSRTLKNIFSSMRGKMGGHVVPRFCNSDLVSLHNMCFCRHGETQCNSQARITRSGELLIKWWKRLRIPWEADNGGSGVFLWYPEQQALGNQVQLNSHPHTPLFGKHLAREVPILIKGCMLVWCMFLLMTCFFLSVVSVYRPVNFPAVWAQLCACLLSD